MGDILVCPKCQERLWVGDIHIPLVTCPKCLARVVNPSAKEAFGAGPAEPSRTESRWVLPVEEETSEDVSNTAVWLSILMIFLFFGAIITALVTGAYIPSILMAVGGVVLAVTLWSMRRGLPEQEELPSQHLHRVQRGEVTVFDYAAPRRENTGAAAGGFILAMVMSFGTMIGTAAARDAGGRPGAVAVFVISVGLSIFIIVRAALKPQRREFFRGLLMGSILGAFGCGPCAAGVAFLG